MILIIFAWVSVILFIILAGYKFYQFKSMPLNLRWEVYPVPHETPEKRVYGGSYMESVDWVKRSRSASKWAELAEMGSEIFLLKRVRQHNPYGLWPLSMAMHWGIYMLLIWIGLLFGAYFVPALANLSVFFGIVAFGLGTIGSLGLIVKRATNQNLELYSAPVDYFNLAFLAVIFGLGIVSWLMDPLFLGHQTYIGSMLTFKPASLPLVVVAMFLLLQTFAIYMPFSKLIHYLMKHFTFTEVLWDDDFKTKGSRVDQQIEHQLSFKPTWAGPHLVGGVSWLEEAQGGALEGDDQ
ncbi:MAG: respiratory nitrate reductase subunit gamma [Anaerolineales bacterium]|jgi:nitrate reductase gamma subunit|nr:respiratory nitrate reductase subunit gamma [Anaerolineales bacterium]